MRKAPSRRTDAAAARASAVFSIPANHTPPPCLLRRTPSVEIPRRARSSKSWIGHWVQRRSAGVKDRPEPPVWCGAACDAVARLIGPGAAHSVLKRAASSAAVSASATASTQPSLPVKKSGPVTEDTRTSPRRSAAASRRRPAPHEARTTVGGCSSPFVVVRWTVPSETVPFAGGGRRRGGEPERGSRGEDKAAGERCVVRLGRCGGGHGRRGCVGVRLGGRSGVGDARLRRRGRVCRGGVGRRQGHRLRWWFTSPSQASL